MRSGSVSIAVIGTFTIDALRPFRGRESKGFGGLYYSLMILAGLLPATGRIYPVARVGRDLYRPLDSILKRFPGIDRSCLFPHDGADNTVQSWYREPGCREEVSLHLPAPLGIRELRNVPETDLVYINCISGRDVHLQAAERRYRRPRQTIVYLDYHSMAFGIRQSGQRFRLYRHTWPRWTALADIVQMNQDEASLLHRRPVTTIEAAAEFAAVVFSTGPHTCLITLGRNGAWLFDRSKPRKPVHVPVPAPAQREDIPGCGDAFGAGFIAEYLRSGDLRGSVHCGHQAAAAVAALNGSRQLAELAHSGVLRRRSAGSIR